MTAVAIPTADAVPVPRAAGDARDSVILGLLCALLFGLANPFLALFVTAMIAPYKRIPVSAFVVSASVAFSLLFYFRDYGVYWYELSTDDVPNYMYIYQANYGVSLAELFEKFVTAPNGNEILWQLPWWALLNVFDASEQTFVFLHYLAIFLALFAALSTFSTRLLPALALVFLLLTPISLDGIAHIWRQQLAASMFLAGVGLYCCRGLRVGKWLMFASPFVHVSFVFFALAFLASDLIRRRGGYNNRLKFSLFLIPLMMVIPAMSSVAVTYLDSIGMARIMSFFEGYGVDTVRVYLLMGVYAVPLLGAFYLLKNDAANILLMTLCFAVFSIVLALPGSNSIYDRLLLFTIPLLGLFFYRCFLLNFSGLWHPPLLIFVFVSGMYRLYLPTQVGEGVANYIGYGEAFDPSLGILKMLVNFIGTLSS